jgi:hypothetical protein
MIYCWVIRNLLTAALLAGEDPGWPLRSHTRQCLGCQAHAASVRATRRRLGELGNEQVAVPSGFEARVMGSLEEKFQPLAPPGRWVRAAGASVAAALLAALWMRRRAIIRT